MGRESYFWMRLHPDMQLSGMLAQTLLEKIKEILSKLKILLVTDINTYKSKKKNHENGIIVLKIQSIFICCKFIASL